MRTEVFIELEQAPFVTKSLDKNERLRLFTDAFKDYKGQALNIDEKFEPFYLPPKPSVAGKKVDENSSMIYVANIESADYDTIMKTKRVKGVFVNPTIHLCGIAPQAAVGTDEDVKNQLCVSKMKEKGMTGEKVLVAVVDGGINTIALANVCTDKGLLNAPKYFNPPNLQIFAADDKAHGTMVAYDVLLAAPNCTLIDVPLPFSNGGFKTTLKNALTIFNGLNNLMTDLKNNRIPQLSGFKSLVVTNSWAMYSIKDENPVIAAEGKYSDNINHPFNRLITSMAANGIDILFAAGNCGEDDRLDGRCDMQENTIYGANSHPDVFTVAAATVHNNNDFTKNFRLGYSNRGNGLIDKTKPDIAGFAHFGIKLNRPPITGFKQLHTGTSVACPVVAGVIAAMRSLSAYADPSVKTPKMVRDIILSTARSGSGPSSDDWNTGTSSEYKVIYGTALMKALFP